MKEFITPATLASQVRMLRTQFSGACMFVEGDTDARLFGNFMNRESCKIIDSRGREKAIGALQILEQEGTPGVLSIVDADFTRITGSATESPNLLLTDGHDLEIMMWMSPALEKILAEFGSEAKMSSHQERHGMTIRDFILQHVYQLGLLRLYSLEQGVHLTFEGLSYEDFLDNKQLTCDTKKMITAVKNKSQNKSVNDQDVLQILHEHSEKGHEAHQVCCGHDVIGALSVGLRRVLGTYNANEVRADVLERSLRLAYDQAFFHQTALYNELLTWQQRNAPYQVTA
ncbi:DUF4435 domain-containing protein [Tumebacillus permanentifrigoris]|uniref:Uncharacterized protein DUF4435 n=1 Tax=Tumebacillus permanentifrigoris TaxID=378543 RepID=A0A316DBJ8_9BACL|nr:DUF4435 domain-containing protein [Tumebacillus permanentifrigoris]PWK15571.1 uncharacterized protein DUF4435 [Tumebacillus permanentifrigoris]